MKVTGLNGRIYNLAVSSYLIDWSPKREVSAPQAEVKRFLFPYWRGHVCTEETRIPGTRMRLDLLNWTRRIAVEVSPQSSHSFNKFFHRDRARFSAAVGRDLSKAKWCLANGFTFVELTDDDIPKLSPAWFLEVYDITL